MFVFKLEDFDADGKVRPSAILREIAILNPRFLVTPDLVHELYLMARKHCHGTDLYIELQVGRSVEDKLMFRFIS